MKFVCTDRLSTEEQTKVIANEILEEYPNILNDQILEMSLLSNTIHEDYTEDTMFQRYYVILQVLDKNSEVYNKVYSDMVNVCKGKLKNRVYVNLYNDVVRYQNKLIEDFPCISDYYEENRPKSKVIENTEKFTWDINTQKANNSNTIVNEELLPDKISNNNSIWMKIKNFFKRIFDSKK